MSKLFIEVIRANWKESSNEDNEPEISLPISSFLAVYVLQYLKRSQQNDIKLYYLELKDKGSFLEKDKLIGIPVKSLEKWKFLLPQLIERNNKTLTPLEIDVLDDLKLPIFYDEINGIFISGICAVCRAIVLHYLLPEANNYCAFEQLLGFKKSCLLSPSDVSPWTNFCEVVIVTTLKNSYKKLPLALFEFEAHMANPVRSHNIYKLAQQNVRENLKTSDDALDSLKKDKGKAAVIHQRIPKEELPLKHRYVEGICFTIADLILYPCIRLIVYINPNLLPQIPLLSAWMEEVKSSQPECERIFKDLCDFNSIERAFSLSINNYAKDPLPETMKIMAPSCRKTKMLERRRCRNSFVSNEDINAALQKLNNAHTYFPVDICPVSARIYQSPIDWDQFESFEGSGLPKHRLIRKRQQLQNLTYAVQLMAKDGDKIVDFCSGTGHLGILLAMRLPKCSIILMENKSYSLRRAKKRVDALGLSNVRFYQTNINNFRGKFNVGTSLHACGTATDVVLRQCYRAEANFICCPCCYGSIRPYNSSGVQYPSSRQFHKANITLEEFIILAHGADQAHAPGTANCVPLCINRGRLCMKVIDTDRKLLAEELGYQVSLTYLKPKTCTPKNHLLVGIKRT